MTDPLTIASLLGLGYILLAVEFLVLPGVGIPGVLGTGLAGAGCYYAWVGHGPVAGVLSIVGSAGLAILGAWWVGRSGVGRRLVLHDAVHGQSSAPDTLAPYLGRTARVRSALRPAGVVEVDGSRRDAVADGGAWIEVGAEVVVLGQRGTELVVARATSEPTAPPTGPSVGATDDRSHGAEPPASPGGEPSVSRTKR